MRIKKIVFLILFPMILFSQASEKIGMMTEVYPPYGMKKEGKITGLSVEVLGEILKKIGSSQSLEDVVLTSWARAYTYAQTKKNSMVFSTTRTQEREKIFKWVGPVADTTIGIFALKSKGIKIHSLKELEKYKIGTVAKDIGEQMLEKNGVSPKNIFPISGTNSIELSFKKMQHGRIDMFAYSTEVAAYQAKLEGIDISLYEVVHTLKKGKLYFAFNKNTDDEIIKKWQKALDEIKTEGIYEKIVNKY